MKSNVIETNVKKDLCVGCGTCSAICPNNVLKMEFNRFGEYNPILVLECSKKCGKCSLVCPFSADSENEYALGKDIFSNIPNIKYQREVGYYLNCYIGYSNVDGHRQNGASGGMATWILESLLINRYIDHVVCVTPNEDSEKLFKFAIFSDIQSIRGSSRSVYYPTEMSDVIRQIIQGEGKYAFTGLPCFIKSLRLAMKINKDLRSKVCFLVGLVCGQMKSKYYTNFIAALSGVNGRLKWVNYRAKKAGVPASNFHFHCRDENGNKGSISWNNGVSKVWTNRWFTLNACNFCDDIFAELADVSLMDAWLYPYYLDSKGTNLLIVRSPLINEIINFGITCNQITVKKVQVNDAIRAQSGVLKVKGEELAYRIYLANKKGIKIPNKRLDLSKKLLFPDKKIVQIKGEMQKLSKELFIKYFLNERLDFYSFNNEMNSLSRKLCFFKFLSRIFHISQKISNIIKV